MKLPAILTAATLALSGCMAPAPDVSRGDTGGVLVVTNDRGGSGPMRKAQIDAMRRNGTRVHIKGLCASACTLFLGLPRHQVCATRQAVFAFHAATQTSTGRISDWWTFRELRAAYHPGLWAWFEANAAHLQGSNYATLTGAQMIDSGFVREC